MDILVWAIICVVCLVAEAITIGDLITIWFALGALVTCLVALFTDSTTVQVIVFVIISFASMLALRPIFIRALKNSNTKTNIDAMIGVTVKLISPITVDTAGSAKLDGVIWSAISKTGEEVPAGTYCEIVKIEGNKLVVKPKKSDKK